MKRVLLLLTVVLLALTLVGGSASARITSIDTMKESFDHAADPMTQSQIDQHVNQLATLGPKYITVDTPMDRPARYAMWVDSIRRARTPSGATIGVWHRPADGGWPNTPWSRNSNFSPSDYLVQVKLFILGNPSFFKPGDVFDANSEPDSDAWWTARSRYPEDAWWNDNNPPVAPAYTQACNDFNQYLLDLTYTANAAFAKKKINGVNANVHSIETWWATANCLKDSTVASLGNQLTIDAADDAGSPNGADPATLAAQWEQRLTTWHNRRPTANIWLGEYGYSNDVQVSDANQAQVIDAVLNVIWSKSYVVAHNYWTGVGGPGYGGYTNIFTGSLGAWSPRQAASVVAAHYGML